MDDAALLGLYDTQLRGETEVSDAPELTRIGPLFAATFPVRARGFVTHKPFEASDSELDALIDAIVDHYDPDPRVDHVEWKTRGHDPLPGLLQRLAAHGFELEEVETIMAGTIEAAIAADPGLPDGYTLERATTTDQILAAGELAGEVFGDSPETSHQRSLETVRRQEERPDDFELWAVKDPTGAVVCTGRVDFVDQTEFAGLWGGACHEDHRGLGLYRAVVGRRARSAAARGKKYLQIDCSEHSRPILQRAGLVPITTSTPAVWRRSVPLA